jgi:hypothetical protein
MIEFAIHRFRELYDSDGYNVTLRNPWTQRMLEKAVQSGKDDAQVIDPNTRARWMIDWRKDPNDPSATFGLFVFSVSVAELDRERSDDGYIHTIRMDGQTIRDVLDGGSGNAAIEQHLHEQIQAALAHNQRILIEEPDTGDRHWLHMQLDGSYTLEQLAVIGN